MAAKLPAAWFPNPYMGTIRRLKVDRFAPVHPSLYPYFDTWAEAHEWLVDKAKKDLEKSSRELESNRKRLMRALEMTDPTTHPTGQDRTEAA